MPLFYTIVTCDNCGAPGKRASGAVAPSTWKYLVTRTTPPGNEIILYACSINCVEAIENKWAVGPGVLKDVLATLVNDSKTNIEAIDWTKIVKKDY